MAIDLHTHYLPEPVAEMMRARTSAPFISAGGDGETLHMPNGVMAIGTSFWDMDARPFDSHPVRSVFFPQRHGTRTASIIVREAPDTRLVFYRYPRGDMARMRELIAHAANAGGAHCEYLIGQQQARAMDYFRADCWTARQHAVSGISW